MPKGGLTGTTGVLGVIGDPIAHSLSPVMQNAALQALQKDFVYVPFQVNPLHLQRAIDGVRSLGIRGLNVTIPHKERVMDYLDEVDPVAQLIGAVNTIDNKVGRLIGYNTDGIGFLRSLREEARQEPEGKNITILGAGGAARAIGFQLALTCVNRLLIANRTERRAVRLAGEIARGTNCQAEGICLHDVDGSLPSTDILINTTSLGMYPEVCSAPPIDLKLLPCHALVCDIVYNPGQTLLLQRATANGLATLPGLGMLAYQGAAALEIWLGARAPVDIMKAVLREQLMVNGDMDNGI